MDEGLIAGRLEEEKPFFIFRFIYPRRNASRFPVAKEPERSRSIEGQRSGTIIRAARIIDGNRFRWYAKSGN